MSSPFQDAAALASSAVDDTYGEPFTYQPMTAADVNARPSIDANRAALTITAVLLDSFARAHSGPARTQGVTSEQPGHASTRPQLSLDPAALPYTPRRGDIVTRGSDGSKFLVAEPRRPDDVRIILDLNRM
jgi:hypothetical protein